MIRGRPVRFLVTILGGWTAMRVAMVLPITATMTGHVPQFVDARPPHKGAADWMFPHAPSTPLRNAMASLTQRSPAHHSVTAHARRRAPIGSDIQVSGSGWSSAAADSILGAQLAFAHSPRQPLALAGFTPGAGLSPAEGGVPQQGKSGRWSGAAWMLWRNDRGASSSYARGARLGASQAGVRVDYGIAPASTLRPAVYGRASTALQGQAAAEFAAGIAIRPPSPLPITLAIERRSSLSDGGRDAFAVLAAGGLPPVAIGHGFRLDGYAQAGLVGFDRQDGFADGRLTVERPVSTSSPVAVGAGLWGGAQPGASRLDVGPQASVRLRLGGTTFRLGAEWRAQVAGNAAPSSGPALSIGTDF